MKLEIPQPMTLDQIAKYNKVSCFASLCEEIRVAHKAGEIVAIMDRPESKDGCLWKRK